MRTLTMSFTRALIVAVLVFTVAAPLAAAEKTVIYLNKDQPVSDNITAHLVQVVVNEEPISNEYMVEGNPEDYLWPTLYYYYENKGPVSERGYLTIRFKDDQGDEYKVVDAGTMELIRPGGGSGERTLNVGIPKDRKVVSMDVIKGFDTYTYELTYPSATPAPTVVPTSTAQPAASSTPAKFCLGSWALPLLIGGVVILGTSLRSGKKGKK